LDRDSLDLDSLDGVRRKPFHIVEPLESSALKNSADRFEGGSHNVGGILALGASVDLLLSIGVPELWKRLQEVVSRLSDMITECGGEVISSREELRRSGILACEFAGRSLFGLREQALRTGVVLNHRRGFVRLSPHVYTNEADLNKLRDELLSFLGR
jgi:selenocysteine lyase/cysteine desulfurase